MGAREKLHSASRLRLTAAAVAVATTKLRLWRYPSMLRGFNNYLHTRPYKIEQQVERGSKRNNWRQQNEMKWFSQERWSNVVVVVVAPFDRNVLMTRRRWQEDLTSVKMSLPPNKSIKVGVSGSTIIGDYWAKMMISRASRAIDGSAFFGWITRQTWSWIDASYFTYMILVGVGNFAAPRNSKLHFADCIKPRHWQQVSCENSNSSNFNHMELPNGIAGIPRVQIPSQLSIEREREMS